MYEVDTVASIADGMHTAQHEGDSWIDILFDSDVLEFGIAEDTAMGGVLLRTAHQYPVVRAYRFIHGPDRSRNFTQLVASLSQTSCRYSGRTIDARSSDVARLLEHGATDATQPL